MEDPRTLSMTPNMSIEGSEAQEEDPSARSSQDVAGFNCWKIKYKHRYREQARTDSKLHSRMYDRKFAVINAGQNAERTL